MFYLSICLPFQNLASVRAVADHDNLALADLFQTCDVLLAGFRQLVKALAAGDVLVEALEFLVKIGRASCRERV